MAEILARLDRTGLRVLCGMPNERGMYICPGELARIAVMGDTPTLRADGHLEWEGQDKRVLCMLAGWKMRGRGHLTLNNHSIRLQRVAAAKISRGELAPDQLVPQGRPRTRRPIPEEQDVNRQVYGLPPGYFPIFPGPLGILADCPRCGHVSTMTTARLRVASR